MARYELTMVDGEKILVDHPIDAMGDMGSHLAGAGFVLFKEIKAGSNLPPEGCHHLDGPHGPAPADAGGQHDGQQLPVQAVKSRR